MPIRLSRLAPAAAVLLPLLGPWAGAAAQQRHPDRTVAAGGALPLPRAWHAATDKNKPLGDAKIVGVGAGLHVTLGPAVVLWRDRDTAAGAYRVAAKFTQAKHLRHPEGYGLFIGGSHLADARNRYTYFLVRGDGKFLVKRRVAGDSTATVSAGWTDAPAIVKADAAGLATNELSIQVGGGKVHFRVNGEDVYTASAARVDTHGIVGYRVNHNLDVQLSALAIHKS